MPTLLDGFFGAPSRRFLMFCWRISRDPRRQVRQISACITTADLSSHCGRGPPKDDESLGSILFGYEYPARRTRPISASNFFEREWQVTTDLRIASATLHARCSGAFPNIDRRTMTAGRYEGATAEKAVPFPSVVR